MSDEEQRTLPKFNFSTKQLTTIQKNTFSTLLNSGVGTKTTKIE